MKVLIIGLGAIGSLMAYALSKDKLISRIGVVIKDPSVAPKLRKEGVKFHFDPPPKDLPEHYRGTRKTIDPSVRYFIPDDDFFSVQQALTEVRDWDIIVLAVKTYDVIFLARDIAKFYKPKKSYSLLLVQNGWGTELEILEIFKPEEIIVASVTIPVEHLGPYHFKVYDYSKKGIAISPVSWENKFIRDLYLALRKSGTNIQLTRDWRAQKLSKLLLNIIANATSAITGLLPNELFTHNEIVEIEKRQVNELINVLNKLKLPIVYLPGYMVPLIASAFKSLPVPILKPLLLKMGSKGRGEKAPSLLEDLRRGKRESEVDWLNGAVVKLASELGLKAPVNEKLTQLVKEVYNTRKHLSVEELAAAISS